MSYSKFALVALFSTSVAGHGLLASIQGANGVEMPGLSVRDGTPRDCSTLTCGSQDDTSIINDRELGSSEASALGKNQFGPVNADDMIQNFMGTGAAKRQIPGLEDFIGGGAAGAIGGADTGADTGAADSAAGGYGGDYGGGYGAGAEGGEATSGAETMVASTAGAGAEKGLPTAAEDGTITMTYHQVNQDGAGPLEAAIDSTSGGKDVNAFQAAEVTTDVPGLGFGGGISSATSTDFPVEVKMAEGTTCDGEAGGVKNVCIVRVRNGAGAGPFGGSAAFTQSKAARKRAIAFRMKMKRQSRRSLAN